MDNAKPGIHRMQHYLFRTRYGHYEGTTYPLLAVWLTRMVWLSTTLTPSKNARLQVLHTLCIGVYIYALLQNRKGKGLFVCVSVPTVVYSAYGVYACIITCTYFEWDLHTWWSRAKTLCICHIIILVCLVRLNRGACQDQVESGNENTYMTYPHVCTGKISSSISCVLAWFTCVWLLAAWYLGLSIW